MSAPLLKQVKKYALSQSTNTAKDWISRNCAQLIRLKFCHD